MYAQRVGVCDVHIERHDVHSRRTRSCLDANVRMHVSEMVGNTDAESMVATDVRVVQQDAHQDDLKRVR